VNGTCGIDSIEAGVLTAMRFSRLRGLPERAVLVAILELVLSAAYPDLVVIYLGMISS